MTAVQKQQFLVIFLFACLCSAIIYYFLSDDVGNYQTQTAKTEQTQPIETQKPKSQGIVKWVDEKGGVHYSDEPRKQAVEKQLQASGKPKDDTPVEETTVYKWINEKGEVQYSDAKPESVKSFSVTSYRRDQNVMPAPDKKRIIEDTEKNEINQQIQDVKKKMDPGNIQSQLPQLMKDTQILKESVEKRNEFLKKEFGP